MIKRLASLLAWINAPLWVDMSQPENEFQLQNIVEWSFALAMVGFYGVSGWMWWRARMPAFLR